MKKHTSKLSFPILCSALSITFSPPAFAINAVGTETVLRNYFSVNLHMDNCCNGKYDDVNRVINELKYIGVRKARDWSTRNDVVTKWRTINTATRITFHASIPQASPKGQREALTRIQTWLKSYPGVIDAIEGSNEPDVSYSLSQGASLADSALLQPQVYSVGKGAGIPVIQMSVGGGWAPPLWEGNYKKFGFPPADFGNAHVYMNIGEPPSISLKRIGELAQYSVKGKPADTTEFGVYQSPQQSDDTNSAFMHMAPFSAYLLGHVGLSVYALHDDISNVVGFYKMDGSRRKFADYWHNTTLLLTDPNGRNLPTKSLNITFANQKASGGAPLGIKNVVMYKSDGSVWIVSYDEERVGTADGYQTINFDKVYPYVKIYDGRTGAIVNQFKNIRTLNLPLPVNRVFLVSLSTKP